MAKNKILKVSTTHKKIELWTLIRNLKFPQLIKKNELWTLILFLKLCLFSDFQTFNTKHNIILLSLFRLAQREVDWRGVR